MNPSITHTEFGPVECGRFREVYTKAGHYFNDHCLFEDQGTWHFFGIVGPVGRSCYDEGSEVSFAHATSTDLQHWTPHPDVLPVNGTGPDSHHVFAPHVIRHGGTFWMFYTGVDGRRRQRICVATSTDLHRWERSAFSPIITPSLFWANWPGHGEPEEAVGNCRDSHVMQLPDGRFVAYWVAELNDRFGPGEGCCAASISEDLVHWQEHGPVHSIRHAEKHPTRAIESPCVVAKDGHYWLFFKHGWWTYVVRGNAPFDFHGRPAVRIGFVHAAEVFNWSGRWFITHCSADPTDYEYRRTNRTRGLFLSELDWPDGQFPRLSNKVSS